MPRKTTTPSQQVQPEAQQEVNRYFIVNPKGVLHEVDALDFAWRLTMPGYRQATDEEVAESK